MGIKWKNRRNPKVILDRLKHDISVNNDGSFTLHSWPRYEDGRNLLASMIKFPRSLCEKDKKAIALAGFKKSFKNNDFSESGVLKQVGIEHAYFHKREPSQYYLFSSTNLNWPFGFERLRLDGCTLSFLDFMPRKVVSEREKALRLEERTRENFHTIIRIRTNGKSTWQAVDKALFSINLFRGICNFLLNHSWRWSSGTPQPINVFRLGKYQTLHNLDLSIVDKNYFWFEPDFIESSPYRIDDERRDRLIEHVNSFRNLLRRSNYPEQLKKAIVRYNSALDLINKNSAFISLFSILETLTASGGRNFDTTIKRTKFHYKDPVSTHEALEHLRTYRNEFIHEGSFDDDIENDLYQLKRFVEALIRFHVSYSSKFSSLQEAGEFMDFPKDTQQLRRKSQLVHLGLDYLKG